MANIFRAPIVVPSRSRMTEYPVSLRTVTLASSLLLLTAAVPPPTIHTRETDLAPSARHYPVTLRTWTQSLLPGPLYVTPPSLPIGKSADPVPRSAEYPLTLRTTIYSGQETVYFSAPSPPVNQSIDLPSRTPYPLQLRTWTVSTSLPLTVPPSVPAAKAQPSPSVPAPIYPLDLRSITQGLLETPLGGTPQAYLARIPNVAPSPLRAYPESLRTVTQNLLQTTLAQPAVRVPGQFDTSVSWLTPYPVNLRTYLYYYVTDDNVPPQQNDITTQVPRARSYPHDLRTITQSRVNLLSLTPPVGNQRSTELPSRAWYPDSLRTVSKSLLQTTLNPGTLTPVGAVFTDLPRARDYPSSLRTTTLDLQETTLAPPPVAPPTSQHDWPAPLASVYPHELRTFIKPMDLRLSGKDTFFGGPGQPVEVRDWTAPRAAEYPSDLRSWSYLPLMLRMEQPFTLLWLTKINEYINPIGEDIDQ